MDLDVEKLQKMQEIAKAAMSGLSLEGFKGDVVGFKYVENEFGNIEEGGIGVQYNIVSPEKKPNPNAKAKGSKPAAKKDDKPKVRELMTFQKKGIMDGHVSLLFNQLREAKWIEGTDADFKLLFSGKRKDFSLKWVGTMGKSFMGKSTLEYLFKCLVEAEHGISVPEGYTLSNIIEGHFKDREGNWITGLGKGDAPNKKAIALVDEWVKLLQMSLEDMIQELRYQQELLQSGSAENDVINDEIEEEFAENADTYDEFDEEMQQHRWK